MDQDLNNNTLEDKTLSALRTVCSATHDQFVKISDTIIDKPNLALKYANAGRLYSDTLKRKYDQLALSSTSLSSGGNITPMDEPEDIKHIFTSKSNHPFEKLIEFVNFYKENHHRMSWENCWKEGRDIGLFEEYGNGASLKAVYYRMKKCTNTK